jgi:hypothetical protein
MAAETIRVTKKHRAMNLADVLTKLLPQVMKDFLCGQFMY